MTKTILLVHGRSFKPPKNELQKLWIDALRFGIERDHPDKIDSFDKAKVELVYYGDISNEYLETKHAQSRPEDVNDRKLALAKLKQFRRTQFSKSNYRTLPGYNPWREGLANFFSSPLNYFGLTEKLIEEVAPDIGEYWRSYPFGSDVRAVFTEAIIRAMKRQGDICVIAHSLGSLVAYDVFWKLSHYSEYRTKTWNRDIDFWITLGSPIAVEAIRENLKGAHNAEADRYPKNVKHWLNIAAEDDYISCEPKVASPFRSMKKLRYIESITDKRIYNLAVRDGKSNPHHATGYLIHPTVAEAVAGWL